MLADSAAPVDLEAPMPADQPTPGQVASFDQTLAALGTNLDALITVYGGELADGQHPGISTAGLAEWLLTQSDAVALAEHLAAAVRRLHEAGAAYERGLTEGYDACADELNDKALRAVKSAFRDGLTEGRRQATEGWQRELAVRYPDGYVYADVTAEAARAIASRSAHHTVVSRLVGPWEPDEQREAERTIGTCPRCGEPVTGFTGEPGTQMTNSNGYVEMLSYSRTFLPCGCTKIIDARPALAEPTSGGVVEQGGPLTAEEATADYVALPSLGRVVGTAQIIRTGYLCVTGGDTCPGHRSKWELCGMAPEPVVPLLHTHEAGGPYRDCPECIAKAGHIRRHDPGALIEEPDLYEQGDNRG